MQSDSSRSKINLKRIFQLIIHWSWLLGLAIIISGATGYLVSKSIQPVYESRTTLLVIKAPDAKVSDYTNMTDQQLVQTYIHMLTTRPVLDAVSQELGISINEKKIFVEGIINTQLIEVRVEDTDPQQAAEIANTLISEFIKENDRLQGDRYAASEVNLLEQIQVVEDQIATLSAEIASIKKEPSLNQDPAQLSQAQSTLALYQQINSNLRTNYENIHLANLRSATNVVQIDPAIASKTIVRPNVTMNISLSMVAGLMLAIMAIFLIDYMDDTIKSDDDVTRLLNLPVIGYISETKRGAPVAYVGDYPRSPLAEAFRTLRTNLEFVAVDKPLKVIMIASSNPAEGKSTIAVNLSITLAQGGKRVLLIDADLRRPRIHTYLELPNSKGLSDLLLGTISFEQLLCPWPKNENLQILTSGNLPPNPTDLFASEKMARILDEARRIADVVVVDAPPFLVADPSVLAARVDGVLLVIRPGKTEDDVAKMAIDQLTRAGANIVGVVFNRIPRNRPSYYGGARGYYSNGKGYIHYYSDGEKK
jgi:capsular exopolysaccharide synthesis family protein